MRSCRMGVTHHIWVGEKPILNVGLLDMTSTTQLMTNS